MSKCLGCGGSGFRLKLVTEYCPVCSGFGTNNDDLIPFRKCGCCAGNCKISGYRKTMDKCIYCDESGTIFKDTAGTSTYS